MIQNVLEARKVTDGLLDSSDNFVLEIEYSFLVYYDQF